MVPVRVGWLAVLTDSLKASQLGPALDAALVLLKVYAMDSH